MSRRRADDVRRPGPVAGKGGLISDVFRAALAAEPELCRFAKECGVHKQPLYRFLKGEANLSLDTLDAIAHKLGVKAIQGRKPAR
jgi:DNA-binding phage protein